MAATPSLAAATGIRLAGGQLDPGVVVLGLLTGVVAALLYAYRPPIPQTMVFALVPWAVTASLLRALGSVGTYPPYLELSAAGAPLLAVVVPGLAWVAMLNLSVSRRELPPVQHYLGAMGLGAMVVLWAALVVRGGAALVPGWAVLVLVPNVALLATGLVWLSIGLWSPDFVEHTPITGGFLVFGTIVNGVATATSVAVAGPGAHTPFSAAVRDLVANAAPAVAVVDPTQLWVGTFLLANMGIGIVIATRLARLAEPNPRTVNAVLGLAGVVGFALGFDRLLHLVVV